MGSGKGQNKRIEITTSPTGKQQFLNFNQDNKVIIFPWNSTLKVNKYPQILNLFHDHFNNKSLLSYYLSSNNVKLDDENMSFILTQFMIDVIQKKLFVFQQDQNTIKIPSDEDLKCLTNLEDLKVNLTYYKSEQTAPKSWEDYDYFNHNYYIAEMTYLDYTVNYKYPLTPDRIRLVHKSFKHPVDPSIKNYKKLEINRLYQQHNLFPYTITSKLISKACDIPALQIM